MTADQDRVAVCAEMEQARRDFRDLLAQADSASLRRQSDGTRWTNQQLLFHMLFGYLVVRALLILAGLFGRLPRAASRAFAHMLDAACGRLRWTPRTRVMRLTIQPRAALPTIPSPAISSIPHLHRLSSMDDERICPAP
jgi:hypothetical protein